MKSAILLLLAAAGAALAQKTLEDYMPKCSLDCLKDGMKSVGCETTDLDCFCVPDNYRGIYTAALACTLQACGQDVSVAEVLPAAAGMCEEVAGPYTETWVDGSAVPVTPAPTPSASGTGVVPAETTGTTATETTAAAETTAAGSGAGAVRAGLGIVAPLVLAAVL
ncbi:hypothetical protein OQA88_6102 [Cercophora sp. LCS_1]